MSTLVAASNPSTAKRSGVRFERDRKCARPDCITILCQANPGPLCFVHETLATTARLQREATERDEMLEMMERNYGIGERVAA